MLKLKLQYFGHLIQRADSLGKNPMLGKIEGKRRRGWQRMRWLDSVTNTMDRNLSKLQEIGEDRGAWWGCMGSQRIGPKLVTQQQQQTNNDPTEKFEYFLSLVAQLVKNLPAVQETWVQSLGQKIPWRREWQLTPVFLPGEFHGERNLQATVHIVVKSRT